MAGVAEASGWTYVDGPYIGEEGRDECRQDAYYWLNQNNVLDTSCRLVGPDFRFELWVNFK